MQSSILLIAASGLLQQSAAQIAPDTIVPRPAAYAGAPAALDLPHLAFPLPGAVHRQRFIAHGFGEGYHAALVNPVVPLALAQLGFGFPGADSIQAQRPKAREYSNAYYTRLAIHHWASFATIPVFATEFYLGQKLFNDTANSRGSLRSAHSIVAYGIAGLFAVNTVTGVWNLWEGRKEPTGRLRRYIHAALMIASDAGLVWTGATAPGEREGRTPALNDSRRSRHRTIAIASMGTGVAGYLMMLIWK